MSQESRDTITWVLGTLTTSCLLVGLAVRLILMPYLREHLVKPVREVRRQVTENHHSNPTPTLPDRLEDLHRDVRALTRVMDNHLRWSDAWTERVERQLHQLTRRPKGEEQE